KAALLDTKDETRYDKAAPYIKDLIAASDPLYQGVGHLFQGVIDMERSGLADPPSASGAPKVADPRLQAEALTHLKTAAARLPNVPAAQALYGVALMMSKEAALGRQYLQAALRMGDLEPRYQVWAAWAMIQAGYPEEAVPTVSHLVEGINSGALPKSLAPMLHLLLGEVYQARRTPADLRKAHEEYQKAADTGGVVSQALELRIAQVELLLGDHEAGSKRIANVKAAQSGPAAEALAIVVLKEQKKHDEARALLAEARRRYPESDELVGLDAAIRVDEGQAEEADHLLAEFLTKHPDSLDTRLARARVLSGSLQKPAEARKLLAEVADGDHSAPLVQMALIDIQQRDDTAAAQTIAKLRARWKEAAAADLLDAQLSLAQQDPRAAIAHLDEALHKDPANKLALFWKAQLDEKAGASAEAARVFETIAKEGSTKEVANGVSLAQAAQWALASMAMENQDLDTAIARYQGLLKQGVGGDADRKLRWQLALAQAAKGEISPAKRAVAELLSDKGTTASERVQAANFYRLHDEPALAKAQVDAVLKSQPGHPQAVATAALMLASRGEGAEAARVIRAAIVADRQPPATYLMLAATENLTPPADNASTRVLASIDLGLKVYPDSVELIRARYLALKLGKAANPLASVEAAAKAHPTAPVRRLLIEIYRDENELAKAEDVARALLKEVPKDAQLAATLVHLVGLRAGIAADQGNRAAEKTLGDEALSLVRRFRKQFPTELSFPQAECELAARRGDLDEAEAITKQMDAIAPNSPAGPLMRARISSVRGQTSKTAQAYAEALARNPRRGDVRLALGQANLAMDQPDEAVRQAEFVLESKPDQPAALLMKARGLSRQSGTADAVATRSAQAVSLLRNAIKTAPKTSGFYHEIAEIESRQGHRTEAVAALRDGLKAVPDDYAGLALLTQYLAEPRDPGRPLTRGELRDALTLAESFRTEASDPTGNAALALAIGFHKAGQDDEALPWIEKAAAKLDRPVVHLTFGDILMTKAEAATGSASSRLMSEQAIAEYDKVLKVQASSIEAVNNKAWILHRHLGQDSRALELAEGLAHRADPESLPAEFLDTLGSIQAALNKTRDAEETFRQGLRKAPEFAMLNYHMGKLIANDDDPSRAARAVPYLEKARDGRDSLPTETVADVETLLKKVRP
ncbi:MAG: tetratricopeptide repeat protein, partial [Isosphaeraceae bacterium]